MEISYLYDYPEHIKQIAQWYFDEWACMSPAATVEKVAENVRTRSLSRYEFPLAFVAHDRGELVGAAELKFYENKDYPDLEHWLGGVYVPREHRRKGVASQLIIAAKGHAQLLGIPVLYLQCHPVNIGLYEKLGFSVLHQEGQEPDSVTIMAWQVSA